MSVVGRNERAGTVFSSFDTTSFFSFTSSACDFAILPSISCVVYVVSSGSGHGNGAWLVALGARKIDRKDAVAAFGLHTVRIDLDWKRNRSVEAPRQPFAAMEACPVAVARLLGAGD